MGFDQSPPIPQKRAEDRSVDLYNCEDEPIHTPAAIQPYGMLLRLDADFSIIDISSNVEELLGFPAPALLTQALSRLLDERSLSALRLYLASAETRSFSPIPLELKKTSGDSLQVLCTPHKYVDMTVLEFEPAQGSDESAVAHELFVQATDVIHWCTTLAEVVEAVAKQVRKITGYDRVMVYKFDEDWHGEVIAESKNQNLSSFLGLNYPASDIPLQARELYKRNLIRMLVDVDYSSVKVVGKADAAPFDMSDCLLRSFSPIHAEYLRNMGVKATLTISIMVNGKLWGLIACHHYSRKLLGRPTRNACDLLGRLVSLKIMGCLDTERYEAIIKARAVLEEVTRIGRDADGDLSKIFASAAPHILLTFGCSGSAMLQDDAVTTYGITPDHLAVRKIADCLNAGSEAVFATDHIAGTFSVSSNKQASGLLAFSVSAIRKDWILCFREEQSKLVNWAGEPTKAVQVSDNGLRLHPRNSFALWSEEVRDKSRAFTNSELVGAELFKNCLIELRKQSAEQERRREQELEQQRHGFMASLMHDIKNPVMASIKILEFMEEGRFKDDPERLDQSVDVLLTGQREMLKRIETILMGYKYGKQNFAGSFQLAKFESIVQKAVSLCEISSKASGIRVSVELTDTGFVYCDEDALCRVIENLIGNAIKFSPERASVHVKTFANDSKSVVSVSDQGPGISENELAHVFKRFWRGQAGKNIPGSMGFGLHVCREIVEAHKGRIWCQSTLGEGATFFVEMPSHLEKASGQ